MNRQFNLSIALCLLLCSCAGDDEEPQSGHVISGKVTEKGSGVPGVSVLVDGVAMTSTGANGTYATDALPPGVYTVRPDEPGSLFVPSELVVEVTEQEGASADFTRVAEDQLVHRGHLLTRFNGSVYSVKFNNESILQLDLEQNALWYHNDTGGLVWQTVEGDFEISARVSAVKRTDNSMPVACNVCLGGLMVRAPDATGGENYVHLVTGFTPDGLGVEYKSTLNGVSEFETGPDGSHLRDLRISRVGNTFSLYQKGEGEATWTQVATFNRPDMPGAVQVGVNIYTAQQGEVADLSVIFQSLVIE